MQSQRLVPVFLVVLLCFALSGCGPEGWSTGDPPTAAATTTTSTGTPDVQAAEGPGVGETLSYSSFATDDTTPIHLVAGEYTVSIDHFGTSAVTMAFHDMTNTSNTAVLVSNHSGSIRASVDLSFVDSTYYFHVDANGDWTISVTRNS